MLLVGTFCSAINLVFISMCTCDEVSMESQINQKTLQKIFSTKARVDILILILTCKRNIPWNRIINSKVDMIQKNSMFFCEIIDILFEMISFVIYWLWI